MLDMKSATVSDEILDRFPGFTPHPFPRSEKGVACLGTVLADISKVPDSQRHVRYALLVTTIWLGRRHVA